MKKNNKSILQALGLLIFAAVMLGADNKGLTQSVRLKDVYFAEKNDRSVYVKEKREWIAGQPAAFAIFEVKKDFANTQFFMKAYFYDVENKLLGVSDKANAGNRISSRGYDTIFTTPQEFKKGEEYVLHFRPPASVDIEAVKRVLVVYGTPELIGAKADPNVSFDTLEFQEKSRLVDSPEE